MKIWSLHLAVVSVLLAFTLPVDRTNIFAQQCSIVLIDSLPSAPDSANLDARDIRIGTLLRTAQTFIGTPYCYGSTSIQTFDCSGFTAHVFGQFGIALPHGSSSQAALGEEVKLKDVQPGDLMFFKGRSTKSKNIGHVALVLEVNEDQIKIIHATSRGVLVDVYQEMDYYLKRFVTARRLKL
ncbi:MAG: C40 family peptidase [Flavobacteriales bacterium]|nr:C40 family peptidase [Flavobacteriales bacterium]